MSSMQGQLFTDHGPTETKLCECGCGEPAPIATEDWPAKGYVKGQPRRFVHGHQCRKKNWWVEEDRGYGTPCWIWQGCRVPAGYGTLRRNYKCLMAHRWVWTEQIGPIPEGLTLDHLCRVRLCVNPAHLEPVTRGENNRRASRHNASSSKQGRLISD